MTEYGNALILKAAVTGAALSCLLAVSPVRALDNNLSVTGTLVTEPCALDVDQNTLTVDFGTVIKKGLYGEPTRPQPLTVTLTGCDLSLGASVSLVFTGTESSGLPGYLAATGDGGAGVAIGLETLDGTAIPVNAVSPVYDLAANLQADGATVLLPLQAFVQAEPDAIRDHSLVSGDFSATAVIAATYP